MVYSCAAHVRGAIPAVYTWVRQGAKRKNTRCRMRFPVGHVVKRNETSRVELGRVGADRLGCRSAQLDVRSLVSAVCCLACTQVLFTLFFSVHLRIYAYHYSDMADLCRRCAHIEFEHGAYYTLSSLGVATMSAARRCARCKFFLQLDAGC
jgi:hypothetical protein